MQFLEGVFLGDRGYALLPEMLRPAIMAAMHPFDRYSLFVIDCNKISGHSLFIL